MKLSEMFTPYAIRETLREHWLTGVHCDHEAKTDTATCYCTTWKSEAMPSVGAAVDAWVDHVLEKMPRPQGNS